jgi:hypothetical protein
MGVEPTKYLRGDISPKKQPKHNSEKGIKPYIYDGVSIYNFHLPCPKNCQQNEQPFSHYASGSRCHLQPSWNHSLGQQILYEHYWLLAQP